VYLSALIALAFLDPDALSTQHSANPLHLHALGTQCTSLATHLLDAHALNKHLSANACTVSGPETGLFIVLAVSHGLVTVLKNVSRTIE
jgi:hypothetical protein